MQKVFDFLDLEKPTQEEWEKINRKKHANSHRTIREPLLAETETILRSFYAPYNELLAKLLSDDAFKWELSEINPSTGNVLTLRDALLREDADHARMRGIQIIYNIYLSINIIN